MNSYLHAMGITEWQPKSADSGTRYWLLADDVTAVSVEHPLVAEVLKLLDIDSAQCRIAGMKAAKDIPPENVLWDMRLRASVGRLRSKPLPMLCQSVKGKRELWQQIWQQQQ